MAKAGLNPFEPLEELVDLGVITPEVEAQLFLALETSAPGRIFSHPSSVELPHRLSGLATKCRNLKEANDDEKTRCKVIFEGKFIGLRSRRATFINSLLLEIANEMDGAPPSEKIAPAEKRSLRRSIYDRVLSIFGI